MDYSRIGPNLYVGSYPETPDDVDLLKLETSITAVLSVQSDDDLAYLGVRWAKMESLYRWRDIQVRRVPIQDFDPESLANRLPTAVDALAELIQEGHTVYVHCTAGVNRSPSVVIAYLYWVEGHPLDEAVRQVTSRRACQPYVEAIEAATRNRDQGGAPQKSDRPRRWS